MTNLNKIKKIVTRIFSDARGSHDLEHTLRVYNLCLKIGRKERANLNVLRFSALLHDIGRIHQDKSGGRICHAQKGAEMARKILIKHGFKKGFIDQIVHCIETHRFRDNNKPSSLEAKVLFDADKIDGSGAVGIGRAFLFSGEIGAKLHDKDVDIQKTKEYSKDDTAYREFLVKLSKIKDQVMTREGKRIALERHKFMEKFFKQINAEVSGLL